MNKLKVLNIINALSLALFLPYIIVFKDYFFYGKDSSLELPCFIMFLVTFVCGGIIIIKAGRSNVDSSIGFEDIKLIDKSLLIYVVICLVVGNVINFTYTKNGFQLFYLVFSLVCSAFVIAENVIIKGIAHSTFSKICPPAFVYAVPFAFFFVIVGLDISDVFSLSDGQFTALFIAYGVLLGLIVWGCPVFTVDIMQNYIRYADDYMCSFIMWLKGKDKQYNFEDIKCVRKTRVFYILEMENHKIKIPKFYIHTKELLKILENMGISLIDL